MQDFSCLINNRSYTRVHNNNPSNFDEWMNSFEQIIENVICGIGTEVHLFLKKETCPLENEKQLANELNAIYEEVAIIKDKYPLGSYFINKHISKLIFAAKSYSLGILNDPIISSYGPKGRNAAPKFFSEKLLEGMAISKKEFQSYEPFCIYYHGALENNFNMPLRLEQLKYSSAERFILLGFNLKNDLKFIPFQLLLNDFKDSERMRNFKKNLRKNSQKV